MDCYLIEIKVDGRPAWFVSSEEFTFDASKATRFESEKDAAIFKDSFGVITEHSFID